MSSIPRPTVVRLFCSRIFTTGPRPVAKAGRTARRRRRQQERRTGPASCPRWFASSGEALQHTLRRKRQQLALAHAFHRTAVRHRPGGKQQGQLVRSAAVAAFDHFCENFKALLVVGHSTTVSGDRPKNFSTCPRFPRFPLSRPRKKPNPVQDRGRATPVAKRPSARFRGLLYYLYLNKGVVVDRGNGGAAAVVATGLI